MRLRVTDLLVNPEPNSTVRVSSHHSVVSSKAVLLNKESKSYFTSYFYFLFRFFILCITVYIPVTCVVIPTQVWSAPTDDTPDTRQPTALVQYSSMLPSACTEAVHTWAGITTLGTGARIEQRRSGVIITSGRCQF